MSTQAKTGGSNASNNKQNPTIVDPISQLNEMITKVLEERESLINRLKEIDTVLGNVPKTMLPGSYTGKKRGPKTKEEKAAIEAAKAQGENVVKLETVAA